jgi:hypothetical protein
MVHKIQVYEDNALKGELRTLATLQGVDEKLAVVKARAASLPNADKERQVPNPRKCFILPGR